MGRPAFVAVAAAALLAACAGAPAGQIGATASPTSKASGLPPFISSGGASGPACAASDLNAVVAPAPAASGGQVGLRLAFGNQGATCIMRGLPTIQLLDPSGRQIPITNQGVASASPAVVLIPGHVALDAAHPQIGEALLLLGWHTADVQPGTCTRLVTPASVIRITLPGGGAVEAGVNFVQPQLAPCEGKLQVYAFQAVTASPQAYQDPKAAAIAAMEVPGAPRYSSGTCKPTEQQGCLTGGGVTLGIRAAYVSFESYAVGGGASCFVYLFQDTAGWHVRNRACTQNIGLPSRGKDDVIQNVPGACANFHAAPGRLTRVAGCLAADNSLFTLDDGPVYVSEMDAADNLPDGTLWWHVSGKGWVAHDFLTYPQ